MTPALDDRPHDVYHVRGLCPGCGRDALLLDSRTGEIRCAFSACSSPDAVTRLLENPRTQHTVRFYENHEWVIRHPLIERVDDALFECRLTELLLERDFVPDGPGEYQVELKHSDEGPTDVVFTRVA